MIALFGGDDIIKNFYTEKFENIKLKKFNPIIQRRHFLHRPDLKVNLMSNVVEAFRFDFVNKNNFSSENKKIGIIHEFIPSGNFEEDMLLIQQKYQNIKGKIPENYNPKIF